MTNGDPLTEIGVLAYPGVLLGALHGLTELFSVASGISRRRSGATAPVLKVTHWGLSPDGETIERVLDTRPDLASRPDLPSQPAVIIVPPAMTDPPAPDAWPQIADWLRSQHTQGTTLCSVCIGAFLLADTGLLDGRSVTTHWSHAEELARRHPDIPVDADKILIEDGDIITAGGAMAWVDLGLRLIDRFLGPSVMLATARFFVVDPAGREQRFYSSFSPRLKHGDDAILKTQHWLQKNGARNVTLAAMAEVAGLEERTFLRRFRKATTLNPTEYCQRLRVGKARELLELSSRTVDQIAWDVGYEDGGSFRKVFQKVIGLTPGDYRRRFAVRAA